MVDVSFSMAGLGLSDDDEEAVWSHPNPSSSPSSPPLYLVGRFLTPSIINFQSMRSSLANLWHPIGDVSISEINGNRYLFQIFLDEDLNRVLDGSPWTFNRHLLLLHRLLPGEDSAHVPLDSVDIWAQVHHLPFGFYFEAMAQQFGNFIGSFLHYDTQHLLSGSYDFMRIRVRLNVNSPSSGGKNLLIAKESSSMPSSSMNFCRSSIISAVSLDRMTPSVRSASRTAAKSSGLSGMPPSVLCPARIVPLSAPGCAFRLVSFWKVFLGQPRVQPAALITLAYLESLNPL